MGVQEWKEQWEGELDRFRVSDRELIYNPVALYRKMSFEWLRETFLDED